MDWMCLKRETPAPVLVFPLDSGAKGIELRAESTMPLWKELLEGLTDQKDKKSQNWSIESHNRDSSYNYFLKKNPPETSHSKSTRELTLQGG